MNNISWKLPVVYVCILVLHVASTTSEEHCKETYKTPTGLTCNICPPGTFKRYNCTVNNTGDLCEGCPENTYQTGCNIASHCAGCDPGCKDRYAVKIKNCTLYENVVCECVDGRYWKNETEKDGACATHDKCSAGYGMVRKGNQYVNTECGECVPGETFSTEESFESCKACKTCKEYKTQCNTTKDAVCLIENDTETDIETASIPTRPAEDQNPYKIATAVLSALIGCAVLIFIFCVVHVRRQKGRRKDPTAEDGRQPNNQNLRNQGNVADGNERRERRPNPPNSSRNPIADQTSFPNTAFEQPNNQNLRNQQNVVDGNDGIERRSNLPNSSRNPIADPTTFPNAAFEQTHNPQDLNNLQNVIEENDGTDPIPQDIPGDQNEVESTSMEPSSVQNPLSCDKAVNTEEYEALQPDPTSEQTDTELQDNLISILNRKQLKDLTEDEMLQIIGNLALRQDIDFLAVILWQLKGKDFHVLRSQIAEICQHDKKKQLDMSLRMLRSKQPHLKIADLKGLPELPNAQISSPEVLDIPNKRPNAMLCQSEEETSNLIALEEGGNSTNKTGQTYDNQDSMPSSHPAESCDIQSLYYNSSEYGLVHPNPRDPIIMDVLKEGHTTEERHQLNIEEQFNSVSFDK